MSVFLKKPKILRDVLFPSKARRFGGRMGKSEDYKKSSFLLFRTTKNALTILATLAVFLSFSGLNISLLAPTAFSQASEQERQALEGELKKIEEEIDGYEKNISDLQNQRKTLSQSISLLNAEMKKLELQIKATDVQLKKLDQDIGVLQKDIGSTQNDIERFKLLLAGSLRQIYNDDGQGILEMVLSNEKVSDLFNNINGLALVQEEMRKNLGELVDLKTNLITQKDSLSTERGDVLNLKKIKEGQKSQLDAKKKEKNYLVSVTKGKESAYQDLLEKSKQTAAQIRSRIFEFLGGGELTFGEAYKLAKFVSKQTGVRAALILAVLDKESGLGRNVGRCSWKEAMHPRRDQSVFLELTKELGLDPDSLVVSCPILTDGAYGGAMGPAQFIPSTWVIYKNKIAAITGNNPPSPWRSVDAFAATALYLKDLGADAQTYAAERKAAAKYYAGSRWKYYLYSYGINTLARAQKFQEDIDNLEGR